MKEEIKGKDLEEANRIFDSKGMNQNQRQLFYFWMNNGFSAEALNETQNERRISFRTKMYSHDPVSFQLQKSTMKKNK